MPPDPLVSPPPQNGTYYQERLEKASYEQFKIQLKTILFKDHFNRN